MHGKAKLILFQVIIAKQEGLTGLGVTFPAVKKSQIPTGGTGLFCCVTPCFTNFRTGRKEYGPRKAIKQPRPYQTI